MTCVNGKFLLSYVFVFAYMLVVSVLNSVSFGRASFAHMVVVGTQVTL